ncbi:tyrosine-type recombinase/integrase [Paenibacillus sp. FSL F4-0125]|uniref:tyrosine-type recombinase/integrase n=1 Tax=Paenibacillus sp. FSL F4-0125 TaxID=2954730 RepID=UPI0030FB1A4D
MRPLIEEIERFLSSANYVNITKQRYRKHLITFTEYLSKLINEPVEQVTLSKIYYISMNDAEANSIFYQIDAPILDEYFELHLAKGYRWLAAFKSAISSLFKYLGANYDFQNPIYEIEFRLEDHKPEPKNKRILNRQEILKLMMSIVEYSKDVERDCLLFVTLLSTGCRIDEVLNLKKKDIRTENHVFFLAKTKNKRSKYVVTRIGLTKAIEIYCQKNHIENEDYIFTNGSNSKPISQSSVRKLLNYYLEKKNILPARIHDTRRSFATIMYENGTDIDIIRQLINHETINSTKIYIGDGIVRNKTINIPLYDSIFSDMRKKRLNKTDRSL